jgi:PAS domain S-box-containing protein
LTNSDYLRGQKDQSGATGENGMEAKMNPQSPRIMIVDDVRLQRTLIRGILHQNGYLVLEASSGLEALQILEQDDAVEVILLDILMPEMGGFEVLKQLKADPRTRDIRVIMLSGVTRAEDKVRAFQMGAADYMEKSCNVAEVLARVGTHVELRRASSTLQSHHADFEHVLWLLLACTWQAERDADGHLQIELVFADPAALAGCAPAVIEAALQVALTPLSITGGRFSTILNLQNSHNKPVLFRVMGSDLGDGRIAGMMQPHAGREPDFRTIFERSPAPQLLVEPKSGVIWDANQAAVELYGWQRDDLQSHRFYVSTKPPEGERSEEQAERMLEGPDQIQADHRLGSGEMCRVEVFTTPVEVDGQSVVHCIIQVLERSLHPSSGQ